MSADPLVTVIIATYNAATTLKFTLKSLVSQEFTDFEAWVVGDACTDNSSEVVQSFNDVRLNWINLEANSGSQTIPNNEGLRLARGRYIAYLGHDDLWFPWHLKKLVSLMIASEADFVFSLTAMLGPEREIVDRGSHCADKRSLQGVPPSSWLHKRDILDHVGYWREHRYLSTGTDADFIGRAFDADKRMGFSPCLSVLKFPSGWWHLYRPNVYLPQCDYSERLQRDPKALSEEILLQLVFSLSRKASREITILAALRSWFRRFRSWLVVLYGPDRWPLGPIRKHRFKVARRQTQRRRGLPG